MAVTRLSTMAALVFLGVTLLAGCQGPQGPQGPAGDRGPAGEPGPEGEAGMSAAGEMCNPGEAVVGFDDEGDIICGPVAAPSATPMDTASIPDDTTAPTIQAFDLQPDIVSFEDGPPDVTFTAHITDEDSGNMMKEVAPDDFASVKDASVSHARFRLDNDFFHVLLGGSELVDGTPQDGHYQYVMTLSERLGTDPGEWQLEYLLLVDQAGNSQELTRDDLDARGMPTSFTVE